MPSHLQILLLIYVQGNVSRRIFAHWRSGQEELVRSYGYRGTVKPLYSEQSRDPNFFSLYGGVHPRGVRCSCRHVPEIPIKLTSQISWTFGI